MDGRLHVRRWPIETANTAALIQIAIVDKGHQVTLYRNGLVYAELSFNTNGLLISRERAEWLVDRGVHSIAVSLDGMSSMEAIRGIPYEVVRERLLELDAAKRRAGSKTPHLAIAYTLMRRNAFDLPKVLRDILPRMAIHSIQVHPLVIYYETLVGENIYRCEAVNDILDEAREVAESHGTIFTVIRSSSSQDEQFRGEAEGSMGQHSKSFNCIDPFFQVMVQSTGDIVACLGGKQPGVNVLDTGLEDIWNHPWYAQLRKDLFHGQFNGQFNGDCTRCPLVHGSAENQEATLRVGVEHSQAERFHRGGYGRHLGMRDPAPMRAFLSTPGSETIAPRIKPV